MAIHCPFGRCENCGREFNSELKYEYEICFCPWCGAEIEWEEDDE